MDFIVRTPHGDAEVTLATYRRDTTIGDLVGVVTGQAVPPLAAIDGRRPTVMTRSGHGGSSGSERSGSM